MRTVKKKPFVWRRPQSIAGPLQHFFERAGRPEQVLLNRLWQHWDMVMGPDIAALAWPLGSKKHVLILGGEDAMSLQDISYMQEEILERANAFMGRKHFSAIKTHLSLDKTPLHEAVRPRHTPRVHLTGLTLSGKYLKDMPKDSPIAECYATYVKKSQKA